MNWKNEKEWADRYMEETIRIIGALPIRLLQRDIRIGEIDEDMKRCTDLKILDVGQKRIGVRHRRWGYVNRFPWDITFRWKARHSQMTEIHKIMMGFGDWFFYGFIDEANKTIGRWAMVDLAVFRKCCHIVDGGKFIADYPTKPIDNRDGTSLLAVNLVNWPSDLVLEHSHKRDLFLQYEMRRKPQQGVLF